MEAFKQWLSENPTIGVISILSSVVSIPLAFLGLYWAFIGLKKKKPRYASASTTIISEAKKKSPALTIHFAGYEKEIETLTLSRVSFWNDGTDTIHDTDVAGPITIRIAEGHDILDANIFQNPIPDNGFLIISAPDKKTVLIEFKYIDKGEGAVIQLFHTGTSDKVLSVGGRIKGAGVPRRRTVQGPADKTAVTPRQQMIGIAMFLIAPFLLACLLLLGHYLDDRMGTREVEVKRAEVTLSQQVVLIIASFLVFWGMAGLMWLRRMPARLHKFYEDL